jgi:hypothetical protein
MLAALPLAREGLRRPLRPEARLSYEPAQGAKSPTVMITLANAFILVLLLGAAGLGVSALVQKRTAHRHRRDDSSNAAA